MSTEHYDVIIIGTGAGGGTLAHTLANAGKRILLLERGNFLPREMANWDPKPVFIDGRYISSETWYDADGSAFQPQVHYYVGGATKLYGAALYRLRPQDFGELRHTDGISPAWPVSYDEFEPYYTKAEWLYQVHGNHGEDPTEGHWSEQYPWPAVSHEPRIQELFDDLQSGGYHPFSAPCGILLDEADRAKSACIRCTWCDGYPCLVHAKSDAETIAVRPVLDLPNVTLLVDAEVEKLETDATGRTVTGVVVARGGATETYEADIVVVSAGASNSAKILLRSANDQHPNGLANGSDQVGRNYMFHNSKAVVALSKELNETVFQKTLGINDFYFGADDYEFPVGQHPDGRQVERRGDEGRGTEAHDAGAALEPRRHRRACRRLLAHHRRPPDAGEPGDARRRRQHPPRVQVHQRRRSRSALPRAEEDPEPRRHGQASRARQELLHGHEHSRRRCRPPGRHLPVRQRSRHLGARRALQGPRGRQPLRRRHELLPEHRRGEPGAHRDGERDPSRRAPRSIAWPERGDHRARGDDTRSDGGQGRRASRRASRW